MVLAIVISVLMCTKSSIAQLNDTIHPMPRSNSNAKTTSELLSGGFIDIVQNGQMNAAARLFRLYIGEPGKFQLPVSVYTGVSSNGFSGNFSLSDIALAFINPGAGILNICFEGVEKLIGKASATRMELLYLAGSRFLSVYNSLSFVSETFFSFVTGVGVNLITGAWEKDKAGNVGAFWLSVRGLCSSSQRSVFARLFSVPANPDCFGYSAGMGIDIMETLKLRTFYFQFLNNRNVPAFTKPFLQLSFNYSIR